MVLQWVCVGLLVGMSVSGKAAEGAAPIPPRFSVENMDLSADPRADFSRFAFGRWADRNPIPADKSRWGGFNELGEYTLLSLRNVLETTAGEPHPAGSTGQKVGDFYASALNTNAIDDAGLKPIRAELGAIASIDTAEDLARVTARLHNMGVSTLFSLPVFADQKQSEVYGLYAAQNGGMSLPTKDYYFADQFESVRSNFVAHIGRMLKLAGVPRAAAEEQALTIFGLEKQLAANAKTPVELRDQMANYHKVKTSEFVKQVPGFPFPLYFGARGINPAQVEEIIVRQPRYFEGLELQLKTRPLSDFKAYLRYHLLAWAAPHLASRFEEEHFAFYGTVLRGVPEMEPRWKRASRVVDSSIGEAVGQLYVARYYPPEAKARMDELIKNVRAVMRDRLEKIDWMTEPTRQKALAKFERFVAQIGHPEKWRDYSRVRIRRDDYFGNVRAANEFEIRRDIERIGKPVDKLEWEMTPATVNAYFMPTANQIVFPAGILQPPFFDFTLDDAVNYGAIGGVIGHEITHGFDDQGRRYDAEGNLTDWWTEEDAQNFQNRAQKLIEQYNNYTALPGLQLNGALSLGENIADLGGTSIAFEALQRSLEGKERKKIDGFTPEQRFFLSWAQMWRSKFRDDDLRRQVAQGPHSPGQFRAIGPIVNMPEFHEAFGIKEGDPMWRKPEDRVKIW